MVAFRQRANEVTVVSLEQRTLDMRCVVFLFPCKHKVKGVLRHLVAQIGTQQQLHKHL